MATAPSPTYRVASGSQVNAGRWPGGHVSGGIALDDLSLSGAFSGTTAPSWATGATSGTWVAIPGTTLASINPASNPALNPNYPSAAPWASSVPSTNRQDRVVTAWNGAAYDETTDTQWLTALGGHDDYGGNEVYKRSLRSASPAWTLVRAPSGSLTVDSGITLNDGGESSGVYPGVGRPRSSHSYNLPVYVPGIGPVLMGFGSIAFSGAGKGYASFFDETTGEALMSAHETTYLQDSACLGAGACYDSSRAAIWWVPGAGSGKVTQYALPGSGAANTGTFSQVGGNLALSSGYVSATYLPDHDCILIGRSNFDHSGSEWRVFDCATGSLYAPTFSGSLVGLIDVGSAQPRWVASLGAVCLWNNSSSTTVINRLTPPANPRTGTWTVDQLPVSGSNAVTPSVATTNGTFGRFAYSPTLGGFTLFNSVSETGFFYKV